MKTVMRALIVTLFIVFGSSPSWAQTGGPVNVKATDTSTGATTEVGDNTNHALRVNIVAGGSNPTSTSATGSAVPASASYEGINVAGTLRGATGVNPSGSIYATQVDLASVAGATIAQGHGTAATAIRVELPTDGTGVVGLATGSNVIGHVVADSGSTTAVTQATGSNLHMVVDSGTVTTLSTVTAVTSITNAVTTKPIDACGTTNEDFQAKIADTTLDSVTATTTCVDAVVVTNTGSAATTILLQDAQGTPLTMIPTTTVAPNGSVALNLAGMKFTSGIKVQANNANNLQYFIKGRQ